MSQKLKLTANAGVSAGTKTFKPHWNPCVGAGRAAEALRSGWMEHMELAHRECGFESVRFHGLFHNDMFVYRQNEDGSITYNFQYVDEIFDRLLDMARTAVNVTGDATVTCIVAKSEGRLDSEVFYADNVSK